MAANETTQQDAVGTYLRVTITEDGEAIDISGATVKQIILKSPSGIVTTHTATFYTTGADGIMQYQTVADDLDESGDWRLQGRVQFSNGNWKTTRGVFTVLPNLA